MTPAAAEQSQNAAIGEEPRGSSFQLLNALRNVAIEIVAGREELESATTFSRVSDGRQRADRLIRELQFNLNDVFATN
jgi:hypothetical protein